MRFAMERVRLACQKMNLFGGQGQNKQPKAILEDSFLDRLAHGFSHKKCPRLAMLQLGDDWGRIPIKGKTRGTIPQRNKNLQSNPIRHLILHYTRMPLIQSANIFVSTTRPHTLHDESFSPAAAATPTSRASRASAAAAAATRRALLGPAAPGPGGTGNPPLPL